MLFIIFQVTLFHLVSDDILVVLKIVTFIPSEWVILIVRDFITH